MPGRHARFLVVMREGLWPRAFVTGIKRYGLADKFFKVTRLGPVGSLIWSPYHDVKFPLPTGNRLVVRQLFAVRDRP